MLNTSRIMVTSNAKSAVILNFIFNLRVFFQDIAHAYLRMYKAGLKILIQLFTQKVHVHINYIGLCVKINIPNVQGNIGARYHPVLIPYQVFEQLKFLGGK